MRKLKSLIEVVRIWNFLGFGYIRMKKAEIAEKVEVLASSEEEVALSSV